MTLKGAEKLQILSDLMRLRQICCDPRLCYGNYKAGSAKLKTCMDLIRTGVEGEHKDLIVLPVYIYAGSDRGRTEKKRGSNVIS